MLTPTRFPSGVTNVRPNTLFGKCGMPKPSRYHVWHDDFDNFEADQWVSTIVQLGSGSASQAISNADGGVLLITNDNADNDGVFMQWSGDDASGVVETWKFEAGKQLWFESKLKVNEIIQSDFVMGLQITDTSPLAVTDGVYFRKDDGDTNLDCVVIKGSAATTKTVTGALVADTFVTLGFYYNGKTGDDGAVEFYVNDALQASAVVTNLPTTEELTISFGIQQGEATNVKTMAVDWITVVKER